MGERMNPQDYYPAIMANPDSEAQIEDRRIAFLATRRAQDARQWVCAWATGNPPVITPEQHAVMMAMLSMREERR